MKNLSMDERQPMLDIHSFLVETAVGNGSGETFSGPTAVNDAIAGLTYSGNGWATTSLVAPPSTQYTSGMVHESNVKGGNVEFSFEGRGVGIIGAVGPRSGNPRVELDCKDMGEMGAKAAIFLSVLHCYDYQPDSSEMVVRGTKLFCRRNAYLVLFKWTRFQDCRGECVLSVISQMLLWH